MKGILVFCIALTTSAVLAASCAPAPEHPSCRNNTMCETQHPDTPFCVASHCVACISHYTCGDDKMCVDGACETT